MPSCRLSPWRGLVGTPGSSRLSVGRFNHQVTAARLSALAAAVLAVLVPIVAGSLVPGYSHTAQYISELGAFGMPRGALVSFAGFLPTGMFAAASVVIAARREGTAPSARIGYLLLMFIAVAYVGAAFARCDYGCPAEGSLRQRLHNLLGVAEYLGGGAGLILLSRSPARTARRADRAVLALAGVVTLLAFAFMVSPQAVLRRGFAQRVAEAALFGSLLLIGWQVGRVDLPRKRSVA